MDGIQKLQLFTQHMDLEPAEEIGTRPSVAKIDDQRVKINPCGIASTHQSSIINHQPQPLIYQAKMPGGKTMPLLKTLLSSACERNCYYCPFRAGRNFHRATFKPEEMAQTFMDLYRAGIADGLFLSSGIIGGGVKTQDKLIKTVEILRHKHHYRGYLHLKIMPGAEKAQVEHLMTLVNRLSVNLEAPNDKRLADLAPMKQFFEELVRPLQWIEGIRQSKPAHLGWNGRWPSTVTQFVVGAVGENDLELLSTSEYLYKHLGLQRAYFSAFRPVQDTPLENLPRASKLREHRLYQASFLFRDYGFDLEEMPFTNDGNLPLDTDPKLAWAQVTLRDAPVEVNRADKEALLRIPGIGPKGVAAILRARRRDTLREVGDLQAIGVQTKRLKPFVLLDGKRPSYQLPLL